MKFSIVTPAFNSEAFIRETIESVVTQKGDFSIEYIVLDNESTDATASIVRDYQQRLDTATIHLSCRGVHLEFVSKRDSGMYEAISRGFANATGDIYAWINSDDVYLPGAFDIVSRTMTAYPEVSWLNGICPYMNLHSTIYTTGACRLYRQDFLKAGLYGPILPFIQQESTFWTADLWKKSGGVNPALGLTGDYFLWKRMAEFAPLVSLNAMLSCFRKTPAQKSANIQKYFGEINEHQAPDIKVAGRAWRYFDRIQRLPGLFRTIAYRIAFGLQPHYLVTLQNGVDPVLMQDTDFFAMNRTL